MDILMGFIFRKLIFFLVYTEKGQITDRPKSQISKMQQEVSSFHLSQLQEMREEEGIFITVWFVLGLFAEATSK